MTRPDSDLYYECHVTIEPVFDERLEAVRELAPLFGFKVADLLMRKRRQDTEERSKHDTFMTGRSRSYDDLRDRMTALIIALRHADFIVWRYKIEDTIIDSKHEDGLNLLG